MDVRILMPDRMSEYMSGRMPNKMSEYVSDRLSVGGDHVTIVFFFDSYPIVYVCKPIKTTGLHELTCIAGDITIRSIQKNRLSMQLVAAFGLCLFFPVLRFPAATSPPLARCSHDGQAPKVAPFASASLDINKDSKRLKVL